MVLKHLEGGCDEDSPPLSLILSHHLLFSQIHLLPSLRHPYLSFRHSPSPAPSHLCIAFFVLFAGFEHHGFAGKCGAYRRRETQHVDEHVQKWRSEVSHPSFVLHQRMNSPPSQTHTRTHTCILQQWNFPLPGGLCRNYLGRRVKRTSARSGRLKRGG